MQFLKVSLVITLMSFQGACTADVKPIEKKPVISLRKGSFSSFQEATNFKDPNGLTLMRKQLFK